MEKNVTSPEQRGLILKIVFIIFGFAFLGMSFYINFQAKKMMSLENERNSAIIPSIVVPSPIDPLVNSSTPIEQPALGMANPASTNCIEKGGSLKIESKTDGSQYGICYFDDNRQCEEWAMMRGDCPVGGLKITGYITPAATFCVISGGKYIITKQSPEVNAENEEGTCTFNGGQVCDASKFYDGSCSSIKSE
ncbi:MAG: DUF333 domain-containing protein [Candidatus Falkowbacteria bacterium]